MGHRSFTHERRDAKLHALGEEAMRARLAAIGLIMAAISPGHGEQIRGSVTEVAGWRISAHTYDQSNRFSHCIMSASYKSGITMRIAISDDYSWRVGWEHPSWQLTKGQRIDLALYVDGGSPYHVSATARARDFVIAELPDSANLFNLLRKGYRLTVYAQGNRYDFNLDGTYAALTETSQCARRHMGVDTTITVPPPASRPAPPPLVTRLASDSQIMAEHRIEATTLVANLLSQGELTGFKILTAKELKEADLEEFSREWHAVWRAENVLGTVRIIPKSAGLDASTIATAMIAQDSKACSKGSFASGSSPDDKSPRTGRVFTACKGRDSTWDTRYIIVPREEGGFYLLGTIGVAKSEAGSEDITRADGLLRAAVFQTLKR